MAVAQTTVDAFRYRTQLLRESREIHTTLKEHLTRAIQEHGAELVHYRALVKCFASRDAWHSYVTPGCEYSQYFHLRQLRLELQDTLKGFCFRLEHYNPSHFYLYIHKKRSPKPR